MDTDAANETAMSGSTAVTSDDAAPGVAAVAPAATAQTPGNTVSAQTAGDNPAAKIDTLFAQHFVGTELGHHTGLWNMVHAFKEDVKKLMTEPTGG